MAHPAALVTAFVLLFGFNAGCSPATSTVRSGSEPGNPASTITLSIIGTNDVHGGLVPVSGRGGLAWLAGYVNNVRALRKSDGGEVLLLDGGDMFQGTLESNLTEGAAVGAAYRAMNYAAVTIGNHEFDFGPVGPKQIPSAPGDDPQGALKARAAEAPFPYVSANLIDDTTGRPIAWRNVHPSVIVEGAGVKVGIVGAITLNAQITTMTSNIRGVRFTPVLPAVVEEAKALRAKGATIVILTAHVGGRCRTFDPPTDLSSCEPSEVIELAKSLPAGLVDAIVAGHTHATIANVANGIPIIESVNTGRMFGRIDLSVQRGSGRVVSFKVFPPREVCEREDPATRTCDPAATQTTWVPATYEGRPVVPDPAVAAAIAPAIEQVAALKATRLGVELTTPLEVGMPGPAESPLGNLFTDVMRSSSAADMVINNTFGGLRAPLPAGPLTYGSLYMTFPFDNRVVTFSMSGADLRKFAVDSIRNGIRTPGISGMRIRVECSAGSLTARLLRLSGQPIQDHERFTVATSSFLAQGGDDVLKTVMPPDGIPIPDDAPLMRDVVADWLRTRGGRLGRADLIDEANPRWVVPPNARSCGGG
jgi:5'-nucleotidase